MIDPEVAARELLEDLANDFKTDSLKVMTRILSNGAIVAKACLVLKAENAKLLADLSNCTCGQLVPENELLKARVVELEREDENLREETICGGP